MSDCFNRPLIERWREMSNDLALCHAMLINKDKIEAATVYKEHRVEDDSFVEIKYICSNIRKRKTQRGKWMALKTMLHLLWM